MYLAVSRVHSAENLHVMGLYWSHWSYITGNLITRLSPLPEPECDGSGLALTAALPNHCGMKPTWTPVQNLIRLALISLLTLASHPLPAAEAWDVFKIEEGFVD